MKQENTINYYRLLTFIKHGVITSSLSLSIIITLTDKYKIRIKMLAHLKNKAI